MAVSRENEAEDRYFLEHFIDDDLITEVDTRRLFRNVIFQAVRDADKYARTAPDRTIKACYTEAVFWLKNGISRPSILALAGITIDYVSTLEEIGAAAEAKNTEYFDQMIERVSDPKDKKKRKRFNLPR